jgi:integrase
VTLVWLVLQRRADTSERSRSMRSISSPPWLLFSELSGALFQNYLGVMSAVRKLVGEAQRNGIIDAEEAANLAGVPNLSQKGTRLGNWLTREQAKELLTVPDRSKIKGERDYAILALLLGCALRRQELASLDVADIQLRQGRWVVADLRGKGGRVRTVAIPLWVKQAIDAWMVAAKIEKGRLLRPLSKSGKVIGDELGDWAIWSVVEQSANEIGIEHFGAHDLRRTCAKLCRKNGGDLEQIKFLLGSPDHRARHVPVRQSVLQHLQPPELCFAQQ